MTSVYTYKSLSAKQADSQISYIYCLQVCGPGETGDNASVHSSSTNQLKSFAIMHRDLPR